jgi:predicted phage tail protein
MPSVWQRIADFVGSVNERTGIAGSLANVFDLDNWLPGGKDAAFTLALIALSAKMAVADGVVSWNGERSGYGNVIEIDHGNGYMTRYAHNQKNLVAVGQRVHAGQVVARVGETGRATGPHCHFEVWLHGRAVNPLTYVNGTIKKT